MSVMIQSGNAAPVSLNSFSAYNMAQRVLSILTFLQEATSACGKPVDMNLSGIGREGLNRILDELNVSMGELVEYLAKKEANNE